MLCISKSLASNLAYMLLPFIIFIASHLISQLAYLDVIIAKNLPPFCFNSTFKIALICSYKHLHIKYISKIPSKYSLFLKFNYNKLLIDFFSDAIISLIGLFIYKYTKKNLQKIIIKVLEAKAFSYARPCDNFLRARLLNIYCGKFHVKYYNLYQYCEDYFAIARAKSFNCIFFAILYLCDFIDIR